MFNKTCINCKEYKRCKDSYASWFFFIIGLIATIAMRVVAVLININTSYAKAAWYTGVIGFFLFFIYRFKVSNTRSNAIEENNLRSKIANKQQLSLNDYTVLEAILCALTSKKERINYFFIFGLSAITILLAIYFDFIK